MEYELTIEDCKNLDIILEGAKENRAIAVVTYCCQNLTEYTEINKSPEEIELKLEARKRYKFYEEILIDSYLLEPWEGVGKYLKITSKGKRYKGFEKDFGKYQKKLEEQEKEQKRIDYETMLEEARKADQDEINRLTKENLKLDIRYKKIDFYI